MTKTITNLNKHNFKSDGIAKVIENSLNDKSNRAAFEIIKELRKQGKSFQFIATKLNDKGIKTRRNKFFFKSSVKNLFDRFAKYYNFNKNAFTEGIVTIESNKVKNFGFLEVDANQTIYIRTDFTTQFKSFTFIEKNEKNIHHFLRQASKELKYSFLSAERRIFVSYFLHINPIQRKSLVYQNDYFETLEQIILERQLEYSRTLQIPSMLWEPICKQIKIDKFLPTESIIIANFLLPDSIKEHILRCIKNLKNKFDLRIYRIQRTQKTFATIDTDALIEEEYITNENGVTKPSHIKIYRTNKDNDDVNRYIKSRIGLLSKPQYKKAKNDDYTQNEKTSPVLHSLFVEITNMVTIFKNENENGFIAKVSENKKFTIWDNERLTANIILKKIQAISKVIDEFKKIQELSGDFKESQSLEMLAEMVQ